MKPELLALGTKVSMTGILSPRYGYINSYSASSDHPYLVKTDDGLEVLCNDNDINVVSYIVDRNAVPTKNPKFEKGQIVFYEDWYARQVAVIDEVDAEEGDYYISYLDSDSGSVWASESELTEISDTSDCLDNAIAKYQDLSKTLEDLYTSTDALDKELRKQRNYVSVVRCLAELTERGILKHARELGSMEGG